MESFEISSLEDLHKPAESIISMSAHKPVVAISGKMGAGKTTLIKTICKAMNVVGNVTSPTFSVVNEYLTASGKKIFHFDFYRLNKVEELYDLGYEEYFYSGNLCLIEWPEIAENILLPDTLQVNIEVSNKQKRLVTIA